MPQSSRLPLQSAEQRLASVPLPCALQLAGGQRIDASQPRQVLGHHADKIIRAYRLDLAGSAMGFEQGWISLFQMLGSRPDGMAESRDGGSGLRARQRLYPFNRAYIYAKALPEPGVCPPARAQRTTVTV